ncbi:aminotransferase class V-fold PLP-dependent enzyme [Sphingomonas sp. 35-24ZXX]|uniref:aminotransferase class V-fold PLP-dependent enzyme n=1 Tax=Sphingomonas sp. 35-24ZXX TaxID=1545915 RepID=UPI00053BDF44|nr:aminotransferase class V-fold PLP-dependent enzyme [Sphingomonas sp. 35-24ZXX]
MSIDRRTLLTGAAAFAAAPLASPLARAASASQGAAAQDEAYWARVAAQYDRPESVIQLENGNWGMMARPVLAQYQQAVARVNRDTSFYARRGMGRDLMAAQQRLASHLGVATNEIVFTRNATEALKSLIGGYNRIGPGTAVLHADLDYDSMQASLVNAARLRGARVVKIDLPEPATHDAVLAAYAAAFAAHRDLKLVLLTHISHRTGLMLPVRAIADMARARGIDTILDAAHSLGQVDYRLPDLGVDFIGFNLHKWIGAPLGVGAMYIRAERLDAIDPDLADDHAKLESIASRVHTGTVDFAALLTLPAALDFQAAIGAPAREQRLRSLRDRWVRQVRTHPDIAVLTPDDPRMHGAITSFRVRRCTSDADNRAVAQALLESHGIFTVQRGGVAAGACVRVTPALCNTMADVDALAKALQELAPRMAKG